MDKAKKLRALYERLYRHYGKRGWWPIVGKAGTDGFDAGGYHPGDYGSPVTARDMLSVCLGAILTQNTAWKNAEQALRSLADSGSLEIDVLAEMDEGALSALIRSSGYFRQKARKIKEFARTARNSGWFGHKGAPEREDLLSVWGIGEETADSMLLYAFKRPSFVMDTYTLRVLRRRHLIDESAGYVEAREFASSTFPPNIEILSECHALFVELAKSSCRKVPDCSSCPVADDCPGAEREL